MDQLSVFGTGPPPPPPLPHGGIDYRTFSTCIKLEQRFPKRNILAQNDIFNEKNHVETARGRIWG